MLASFILRSVGEYRMTEEDKAEDRASQAMLPLLGDPSVPETPKHGITRVDRTPPCLRKHAATVAALVCHFPDTPQACVRVARVDGPC